MTTVDVPVAIVGAGPVGLAGAIALARVGVPCTVLEARTGDEALHPTANHLGLRQMEVLRRWGLADEVRRAARPLARADRRVWMDRLDGRVLYEIERHPVGGPPPHPHSPEHEAWISKGTFDPLLLEAARSSDGVHVRFRHRAHDLVQDPDGVTLTTDAPTGPVRVRASYVLACDGAASEVRRLAGIGRIGPIRPGIALHSVWFTAPQLPALLPDDALHLSLVDPGGMLVALDRPGEYRIHVPGPADRPAPTLEQGAALVRAATGRPDLDLVIHSCSRWELSASLADRFRAGRVLLAGDAAKAGTPFGGLGMGYGLLDVDGLAWKVAGALAGWGGETLLDSHDAERRPAARRLLEYQGVLLDADPPRLDSRLVPPSADPAVLEDGPAGDAARRAYRQALAAHNEGHYDNVGVDLDQRYPTSPIVSVDGTPEPPWPVRTYVQHDRAGHRAPHVWLPDGRSTLDLFGDGFVLLVTAPGQDVAGLVAAAAEVGLPLRVHTEPDASRAYDRMLTLVRPDGHVTWAADAPPSDPRHLIDVARGAG